MSLPWKEDGNSGILWNFLTKGFTLTILSSFELIGSEESIHFKIVILDRYVLFYYLQSPITAHHIYTSFGMRHGGTVSCGHWSVHSVLPYIEKGLGQEVLDVL